MGICEGRNEKKLKFYSTWYPGNKQSNPRFAPLVRFFNQHEKQ